MPFPIPLFGLNLCLHASKVLASDGIISSDDIKAGHNLCWRTDGEPAVAAR